MTGGLQVLHDRKCFCSHGGLPHKHLRYFCKWHCLQFFKFECWRSTELSGFGSEQSLLPTQSMWKPEMSFLPWVYCSSAKFSCWFFHNLPQSLSFIYSCYWYGAHKIIADISDMYHTQNVLGKWSSKLFGIALFASGQSSTITGTYAGQYVMQVVCFMDFFTYFSA